jgi:hypothetical protein
MPIELVGFGGIRVVAVGVLALILIRWHKTTEPPHLHK